VAALYSAEVYIMWQW